MTLYPRTAFVRSAIVVGLVIGISQALTLWFFARNAYLPGIREYARLTVLQAELAFDDSRAAADADLADRLGNATGITVAIPEKLHDGTMLLSRPVVGRFQEELEGMLVWAMEYVADYSSDPHLVEWANVNLAELKGQDDE